MKVWAKRVLDDELNTCPNNDYSNVKFKKTGGRFHVLSMSSNAH